MELELVRSSAPRTDESFQPPSTPFARRLFAAICLWLAISVTIGILRAPGSRQALEHSFAVSPAGSHAAGWPES